MLRQMGLAQVIARLHFDEAADRAFEFEGMGGIPRIEPVRRRHGPAGRAVRRIQRALNAASPDAQVPVNGVFGVATETAVKAYQSRLDLPAGEPRHRLQPLLP